MIGVLIILFFISNLLIGWPVVRLYNNFLSTRYLTSLEGIKLPDNSMVINRFKRFGILHGNGNHCDCEIAVMIESEMQIREFENFAKKPLLLKPPFSNLGNNYSEIYYVNGQQLFRIFESNTIELVSTEEYPYYSISDSFEFYLESDEYLALKQLIKNTLQQNNKNYFIITAFDQTYSGFSMKDFRCH